MAAILLDQYAEARIEALCKQTSLTKDQLAGKIASLVNDVNLALWTLPQAQGKTVPMHGTAVRLEVTKDGLANIERLLKDFGSGSGHEDVGRWIGSLRNAIEINLGSEWLPRDSDRLDAVSEEE